MQLAEISVRRPVFATVASLLVLLVGAVSLTRLAVREYPRIDEPVVTVSVRYAGASAEVVESQIAKPLEDSIAGIDAVDVVTSVSRAEQAQISVRFRLEKDADTAAAEVRDRTSRVRNRLPLAIEEPVIAKVEADAFPVMWLTFQSHTHTPLQLNELVNRVVKPRLQTVPGVADVRIFGERKYAMRVWLDPGRLAAYGITVQEAEEAIRRSNLEVPAGRIESAQREFSVTSNTDLVRAEQFGEIVLKNSDGFPVRMRDVARIAEGAADERSRVRLNSYDAIATGVIRQATANPLELSQGVRSMLPQLQKDLPPGVTIQIANDNSVFIDRSISNVFKTIVEAVVLVSLVIFVFLRTLRASIIPIVTIPVSLIGTFALMGLAGFSLNTLTLLALVLAIGLVVDDAIVVLENIYRHIEAGVAPFAAAIRGSREIGFAVVAMTLTLAAVYAPLAFTPGRTGRLFIEFALALAGAVVVSGFIALTLTPMMSSLLLRHVDKPSWFDRRVGAWLDALTRAYGRLLRKTLTKRWVVVAVMALVALAIYAVLPAMKRELAPAEDRGVMSIFVNAPDGASIDYTDKYARQLEHLCATQREFDRVFGSIGNPSVSQAIIVCRAVDWSERKRSTTQMRDALQPRVAGFAGVQAFPVVPPSLGQGFRERPLNFVIVSSDSYQNLAAVGRQMMEEIGKNPGILTPDMDLRLNKPELRIEVDRERAADAGVSVDAVARAVETVLGGRSVTRYKRGGEQYDVIVQTEASGRDTPDDIERISVRGKNNTMIALASLVKVQESVAPRELNHFSQRRSISITANLAADYSLGQALDFLNQTAARVLKPGYSTDVNGASREFKNSQGSLTVVFGLALLFIFLVLAAQFESFVDPFIIMLSVPLSMIGALLALQWTNSSLNVYSQIGLITLVGLITKHGILIVEFANQLRAAGVHTHEALVQAAVQRLRPILMTTGAMVLGALPLAFSSGAGAESRVQIGWVIVGGMSLGTLLTIFVVPTVYTFLAREAAPGPITTPVDPETQASPHMAQAATREGALPSLDPRAAGDESPG